MKIIAFFRRLFTFPEDNTPDEWARYQASLRDLNRAQKKLSHELDLLRQAMASWRAEFADESSGP